MSKSLFAGLALSMFTFASPFSPASAEASASEACKFFSSQAVIKFLWEIEVFEMEGDPDLNFTLTETYIDRYAVFSSQDIIREIGTERSDGTTSIRQIVSGVVMCEVDIIDRRVLRVYVTGGPSVGEPFEDGFGRKKEITSPAREIFEVGGEIHSGKY